jgi:hypothetical protein
MSENKRKLFGKIILCAVFAPIFAFGARATTIVAVKTDSEIVIGADSKVTDTFGNTTGKQACKIVQSGSAFFAYAGFAFNRKTNFSVPQIAADALKIKPNATLTEKTALLTGVVASRLFTELQILKRDDWDTYREKIEGKIFLRILVAGFENGKPALFVRQFRAVQVSPQIIGVSVLPDDCGADCRGEFVTRFLGETAAIDGLPEETPDFWKSGLAAGVKSLLKTQIAAREEYVGAPIDILRVTARNAEWIQKKPLCPPIQVFKPSKSAAGRR